MILYIDKTEVPDLEDLSPSVLRYCIRKAEQARGRYKHLMDYYLGQHDIFLGKPGTNEVRVSANYAKYVVDVTLGYYLGEAVKYDANQRRDDGDKAVHDDEMETVTPGRIYVETGGNNLLRIIQFVDGGKRNYVIERDKRTDKWHVHKGYEHTEDSEKHWDNLTTADKKLLAKVKRIWYSQYKA